MSTEYSRALLRVALAQICQSLGWQAVQSTPMELLTCILERYLLEIAKTAHRYANQFGRTEPNLDDLGLTFQDLNVHLSDLSEYVQNVDPLPFVADVPKFPIPRESLLVFPKPNSRELREREEYIDDHLPPMHPDWEEAQPSESEVCASPPTAPGDDDSSVVEVDVLSGAPPGGAGEAQVESEAPPAGTEKRPPTTSGEDQPPNKKNRDLPDDAAPHHYKMKSIVMSQSGVLTPTLGIGRLPNSRSSPSPPPILTTKSQFWPASTKGGDSGKVRVKIKPVTSSGSESTKKSSKGSKHSDRSNKEMKRDKSKSKKLGDKSKTKKSTKENSSSTSSTTDHKSSKRKKSHGKSPKSSRRSSKLKLLLTTDTIKSTSNTPSAKALQQTPPRPNHLMGALGVAPSVHPAKSMSSSLVDIWTPSPLKHKPISIDSPGTPLISVDSSDDSDTPDLSTLLLRKAEEDERSRATRTQINSYTDTTEKEVKFSETVETEEVGFTETIETEEVDFSETIETEEVSFHESIAEDVIFSDSIKEKENFSEITEKQEHFSDTIEAEVVSFSDAVEEEVVDFSDTREEVVNVSNTIEEEVVNFSDAVEEEVVDISDTREEEDVVNVSNTIEEEVVNFSENIVEEVVTFTESVGDVVSYSEDVEVMNVSEAVEEVVSYSDTVEEVVSYLDNEEPVASYYPVVAHTEEVQEKVCNDSADTERRMEEETTVQDICVDSQSEVDVENVLDDDVIHNANVRNEELDFDGNKPSNTPATPQSTPKTPGHSEESKVKHIPKVSKSPKGISGLKLLCVQSSGTEESNARLGVKKRIKSKHKANKSQCDSSLSRVVTGPAMPQAESFSPAARSVEMEGAYPVPVARLNQGRMQPSGEERTGPEINTEKEHKKDKKKKKRKDKDKKSDKREERFEKKEKPEKREKSKKEKEKKGVKEKDDPKKSNDQFIPRLKLKLGGSSVVVPSVGLFSSPHLVVTPTPKASTKTSMKKTSKSSPVQNSPFSSPQTNKVPKLSLNLKSPAKSQLVSSGPTSSKGQRGLSSRSPSPLSVSPPPGSRHSKSASQLQSPSLLTTPTRSTSPFSPIGKPPPESRPGGWSSSSARSPSLPPQPSRMVSTSFLPPPPSSAAKKAALVSEQAAAKQISAEQTTAAARLAVEHAAAQKSARAAAAKILAAKSKNPSTSGKSKKGSSKKGAQAASPRQPEPVPLWHSPEVPAASPTLVELQPPAALARPAPVASLWQPLPSTSGTTGVISETVGTIVDEHGQTIWICPACKRQDDGSPMIGCDDCDDWFHWVCVGLVSPPPDDKQWYCLSCNTSRLLRNAGKKKKRRKKMK